jgi:excisionase family DNA binding protein
MREKKSHESSASAAVSSVSRVPSPVNSEIDTERFIMITVEEAAASLHVSASTVYELCKTGRLPCYRIGVHGRGKVLIKPEDLEAFLQSSKTALVPPRQMQLRHIQLRRT